MMRQLLTGLGCLAAALMVNPAFAFQQAPEPSESPRPKAPAEIEIPDEQENMHGGQFDSFGQGYIRMSMEGGKSHLHNVNEQTQVFIDGKPAQLNNLRTGDRIDVTMGPNNVAMKIEVTRNQARQRTAPGEARQSSQRPDFEDQPQGAGEIQATPKATPWLGVVLNESEEGQQGVEIRQTFPSGPAARAGLRGGDVLLQVAGKEVASPEEVARLIEASKPNEPVDLVVLRGEKEVTITATLANRSDFLFDNRTTNRPAGQAQGQEGYSEFEGSNIPEHAMMLEQHRHFASQHERIEQKLDQVLKELEALRSELGQRPAGVRPRVQESDPRIPEPRPGANRPDLEENPAVRERGPEVPEANRPADEQSEDQSSEDAIREVPRP
jgi:hypothetical protein